MIQVTKMGRLITQNTEHIQATDVSAEQYLCDQIRKATGLLEDRQAIPSETERPPRQQVQDNETEAMVGQSRHVRKEEMEAVHLPMWKDVGSHDGYYIILPHQTQQHDAFSSRYSQKEPRV